MPYFTLTIASGTNFGNILTQVDNNEPMTYAGNPQGNRASPRAGISCWDSVGMQNYICTATDGSTNPANTTWQAQNLTVVPATTTISGTVILADDSTAIAGTDAVKALTTHAAAAAFAKKGTNSDITRLTGLTTYLTEGQGGTGFPTVLAAIKAAMPPMVNGQFITNDGSNFLWSVPNVDTVSAPTTNTALVVQSFNLLAQDGITLTMPTSPGLGSQVRFATIGTISNITLHCPGGEKIMGLAGDMTVDVSDYRFTFEWTGATRGWWLVVDGG